MQPVGLSITNQLVILLSLTHTIPGPLLYTASTYKAEQIYYKQNYKVADTNEKGLETCS